MLGQTLFTQDIANDELIDDCDKARLCAWLTISDDKLSPVLSSSAVEWTMSTRSNSVGRQESDSMVSEWRPHGPTDRHRGAIAPLLVY